jgi:hypothetical protein
MSIHCLRLALCGLTLSLSANAAAEQWFITIDFPSASRTTGRDVTSAGAYVGEYDDDAGHKGLL